MLCGCSAAQGADVTPSGGIRAEPESRNRSHRFAAAEINCSQRLQRVVQFTGSEVDVDVLKLQLLRENDYARSSSFPTESSTPLMNWTDSGLE